MDMNLFKLPLSDSLRIGQSFTVYPISNKSAFSFLPLLWSVHSFHITPESSAPGYHHASAKGNLCFNKKSFNISCLMQYSIAVSTACSNGIPILLYRTSSTYCVYCFRTGHFSFSSSFISGLMFSMVTFNFNSGSFVDTSNASDNLRIRLSGFLSTPLQNTTKCGVGNLINFELIKFINSLLVQTLLAYFSVSLILARALAMAALVI